MTEMNKINVAALENVAGGYETHTVHNDAVSYANCRKEPGLNSKVFFRSRALTPRFSSQSRTAHRSTRQAARSRRTAMYGTRSCWQALMTPAGLQAA